MAGYFLRIKPAGISRSRMSRGSVIWSDTARDGSSFRHGIAIRASQEVSFLNASTPCSTVECAMHSRLSATFQRVLFFVRGENVSLFDAGARWLRNAVAI